MVKTNYKKNLFWALEFINKKGLGKEYTKFALNKVKAEIKVFFKPESK